MKRATDIKLIYETEDRGEIGQTTRTETERTVPCTIESITRQEWQMAGQSGFSPVCVAVIFSGNYQGETTAVLEGQKYAIYRTYEREDEEMELYLQEETGA